MQIYAKKPFVDAPNGYKYASYTVQTVAFAILRPRTFPLKFAKKKDKKQLFAIKISIFAEIVYSLEFIV